MLKNELKLPLVEGLCHEFLIHVDLTTHQPFPLLQHKFAQVIDTPLKLLHNVQISTIPLVSEIQPNIRQFGQNYSFD